MRTKVSFLRMAMIAILAFSALDALAQDHYKTGAFWYLPTMTASQAMKLAPYDLLVIDYENFLNNPGMIDMMLKENPKLKLILYLNQTEIFDPMFNDKPWSIKLLKELKEKPEWWVRQPDGKGIGAWTGMKILDMRWDCPLIDGVKYHQWIAQKYLQILKDPRLSGCLVDNCWGDDNTGLSWLAHYNGNKGFDFDRDGKADKNFKDIDTSWTKGMKAYISDLRKGMDKDFIIIANPGNDSYPEVDGKQMENFPYIHHQLKMNDVVANLTVASKYKLSLINPDKKDAFFGACCAALLDNSYLCIAQNTLFDPSLLTLNLGKPKGQMRFRGKTITRTFENGSITVTITDKTSKISYKDGKIRTK